MLTGPVDLPKVRLLCDGKSGSKGARCAEPTLAFNATCKVGACRELHLIEVNAGLQVG